MRSGFWFANAPLALGSSSSWSTEIRQGCRRRSRSIAPRVSLSPKLRDGFCVLHVRWVPKKDPPGYPHPLSRHPGGPRSYVEARDRWLVNPSEQRARTGLSQFVSDAQSVWPGVRTECPHRRRAPEAAGFKLIDEGNFLRNPNDPRDKNTPAATEGRIRAQVRQAVSAGHVALQSIRQSGRGTRQSASPSILLQKSKIEQL